MSAAKHAYFNGLEEFVEKSIFVGNGIADLEKEVQENLLSIDVTPAIAKESSPSDFLRFFDLLTDNRRKQIKKSHGRKMKIYAWFDMETAELNINLISSENLTLPFESAVEDSTLVTIMTQFLQSKNLTDGPAGKTAAAAKSPLQVYQMIL